MDRELEYGTSLIRYKLLFEVRRTLRIEVHTDTSVWVKAPEGTDETIITNRLTGRAAWIQKQQRYYQTIQPAHPPRQYVSGESFRYLGYQHRLKVNEGNPEGIKRLGGRLQVTICKPGDSLKVEKVVSDWYREQAKRVFNKRLTNCLLRFNSLMESNAIKSIPTIELRRMKGRWGSCTAAGKIFLNPDLIQAPTFCIDYVITHELTHLIEHSHRPRFYQVLSHAVPDWKERKDKLEKTHWN